MKWKIVGVNERTKEPVHGTIEASSRTAAEAECLKRGIMPTRVEAANETLSEQPEEAAPDVVTVPLQPQLRQYSGAFWAFWTTFLPVCAAVAIGIVGADLLRAAMVAALRPSASPSAASGGTSASQSPEKPSVEFLAGEKRVRAAEGIYFSSTNWMVRKDFDTPDRIIEVSVVVINLTNATVIVELDADAIGAKKAVVGSAVESWLSRSAPGQISAINFHVVVPNGAPAESQVAVRAWVRTET